MNKYIKFFAIIFTVASLLFLGCEDKVIRTEKYMAYVPKYIPYQDLKKTVEIQQTTLVGQLKNPGKIYVKGNYLFINERYEGIHIYDNSNTSSPLHICFISILGNVDMAVKGDILYADNAIDLISFDISNMEDIKEIARLKKIFEYTVPVPEAVDAAIPFAPIDTTLGIIVGWDLEKFEQTTEEKYNGNIGFFAKTDDEEEIFYDNSTNQTTVPTNNPTRETNSNGVGGSMARFMLYSNILYVLRDNYMQVVNIEDGQLEKGSVVNMNFDNAETLFLNGNNLFVGTQNGMEIYSLQNPLNPSYLSRISHIRSCDPVVVEGNIAYSTLRAGTSCGGTINQLDVIDISDINSPKLLTSFGMTEPFGLGIDNHILFVCDGNSGLKIYDATDYMHIDQHLIKNFPEINAFDVIPLSNVLLMIGSDGFYQYDYSDLQDIKLLSKIEVVRK